PTTVHSSFTPPPSSASIYPLSLHDALPIFLGIASERDIMRAIIPQLPRGGEADSTTPTSPTRVRVRDLMTRSVLCVSEDLSLDEAANMMVNKDVDLFPVVSEGRLVGVITRRDIIRALF